MRLPLRHAPPGRDAPARRCAHLELLAEHAVGLPLGAAAELVAAGRSRGRHGNALQWHLGLEPHDGLATLDWEDRIEIKLVTVWRAGEDRHITCDKLKVCDVTVDPWAKLSNVLWVFADRITRMVVGHRFWRLAGPARERLERSWTLDPHFDRPDLFVEAREQDGRSAPAYYLAARWFVAEDLLPQDAAGVLPVDARWWTEARSASGGRDPLITCVAGADAAAVCPRCDGPLTFDARRLGERGWSPARHGMPLGDACATREHVVVHRGHLAGTFTAEAEAALVGTVDRDRIVRLADGVLEPEDHLH